MRRVHRLAYSWNKAEKADWNCTGLWPVYPNHPAVCPSLSQAPTQAPFALWHSSTLGWQQPWRRGVLSCEGQNWLGPGMASEWGRDSHHWCLQRGPGRWGQDCHSPYPAPHQAPTPAPLAPVLLPSRARVLVLGDRRIHTWQTESARTWASGLLFQQLGTWTTLQ